MKFIRIFWGDLNVFDSKFKTQIEQASQFDIPNQIVYVWGVKNEQFIKQFGFETRLISEQSNFTEYGAGHHMFNHTSLIHKLHAFNLAVEEFNEVIFIDWDCFPIKPFDDIFFELLRSKGPLQVPLYTYPYEGIKDLTDKTKHEKFVVDFAEVLQQHLIQYAYKEELGYVLPNTGFMYCRDSSISAQLLSNAIEYKLKSVPDEFAVMVYGIQNNYSIDDYILNLEPSVSYGKHQEGESYWEVAQKQLNVLTESLVEKNVYFNHV